MSYLSVIRAFVVGFIVSACGFHEEPRSFFLTLAIVGLLELNDEIRRRD